MTCIGDEGKHSCMLSRNSNSISDKSLINAYKKLNLKYKIYSYLDRGSDERQYNYPGIDLGFSSIFKSKYGKYKQYHLSSDDFKFVTLKGVTSGFKVAKAAIDILQNQIIPKININVNLNYRSINYTKIFHHIQVLQKKIYQEKY